MKPQWAQWAEKAAEAEHTAAVLWRCSVSGRCPEKDSGGAQCSRDRDHSGRCHIEEEDFPA